MKLHELLDKTEEDGLSDIVTWKPHGRAFIIRNAKKFAEIVLPEYFGQTKFFSFQRQLNLYDFTRISEGPDKGAYYHEMFLRGKIFLANCITRRKVKGRGIKAGANPEKEPNFYAMSYVGVTGTTLIVPVALQPLLQETINSAGLLIPVILQPVLQETTFDEQVCASFCRMYKCIFATHVKSSVTSTSLINPVALQPFSQETVYLPSCISGRFDEQDAASFCGTNECILAAHAGYSYLLPLTTSSEQGDDFFFEWAQDFERF